LVEVEGRLAPEPSALLELGGAAQAVGAIRQNINLAAYGRATGLDLMPLSVQQQAPVEAPFVRDWPSPVVNVQKHYGYAFQWFAMCALVVGLYVWFQLIQPWRVRTP
jgi:surfeit locus 1 family protein